MPNLLATASTWLGGMFQEHASVPVSYGRSSARAEVTAHRMRSERHLDGEVVRLSTDWADWGIDAADLVLPPTGRTLPAEGDTIEWTDGSTVYVYAVMPPVEGEPVYDWTSATQERFRVHSKLIETR